MTKSSIVGISTVAALIATAIPAALLSGGSNQPKPKVGQFIPQLTSASNIRDKYERVGCLKKYFKKIIWKNEYSSDKEFNGIHSFSNKSIACLIVEYYKKTYPNSKWQGEFRLIWAIKDDKHKQGLVTVTNAKADEGILKGSSAAYILKEEPEDSWNVLYLKEINQREKRQDSLQRLIPQKAESIPGTLNSTDYWGFNPDLQNICRKGDCIRSQGKSTRGSYSWEFVGNNSGSARIHSWTSNIKNWFEQIFGWDNFENKMKGIKGEWQAKQVRER